MHPGLCQHLGGTSQEAIGSFSQLLARRIRTATTSLLRQKLGFFGSKVPWYGNVYTRNTLCRSCRFGLGCGQCAWFAPQSVLTKLDETCTNEISHKYSSYILSWTVSLSGHTGLCACLAHLAGSCRAAATQDRCPHFAVAPSLCVIVFRQNILLCLRLYHKGKNET